MPIILLGQRVCILLTVNSIVFCKEPACCRLWSDAPIWSSLGAACGWSCVAHPNGHIWLAIPGHSKSGKVRILKVVLKNGPFPLSNLGLLLQLSGWPERASWEHSPVEAAMHHQDGWFWAWSTHGVDCLLSPDCSSSGCAFSCHCWSALAAAILHHHRVKLDK